MRTRTRKEREVHLRLLEKALVDGVEPDDLVTAAPQKFGMTTTQAKRDLHTVYRRLAEAGERIRLHADENVSLALSLKRRTRVLRDAIGQGERKLALEAEKEICKLLGIYPQERTHRADVTGGQDLERALDAAIESELAKLAAASEAEAAHATQTNGRTETGRFAVV
ncbi:MAG: hypothetical protein MPJ50_04495 [Pirellulales bacterium]|nr:hypothetical protein [Pirellulales bacterium]